MDEITCWVYGARFWVGEGCSSDLCARSHGAAPHWTQLGPVGFKTDPALAKAEPTSDGSWCLCDNVFEKNNHQREE